ncbi:unnamed protein product [Linum trigynum]|uniref:Uncharacterized protein n=1 Tax=Linum trigynum TaxID=586398 RepID=A0AAV2GRA4_9ROSI
MSCLKLSMGHNSYSIYLLVVIEEGESSGKWMMHSSSEMNLSGVESLILASEGSLLSEAWTLMSVNMHMKHWAKLDYGC